MRVIAIYGRHKIVSGCLCIFLIIESATMLFLLLRVEENLDFDRLIITEQMDQCAASNFLPYWATGYWIPPMIYQVILLGFVVVKAWRISTGSRLRQSSRLLSVLIQDQVLYFSAVITSGSTSILAYWVDNEGYRSIASGFSYALLSIIGSRLLFNLREVGKRDDILNGIGGKLTTLSDMRFTSTPSDGSGEKVEAIISLA